MSRGKKKMSKLHLTLLLTAGCLAVRIAVQLLSNPPPCLSTEQVRRSRDTPQSAVKGVITGWSVELDRLSSISRLSVSKLALKGERFCREALTRSLAKRHQGRVGARSRCPAHFANFICGTSTRQQILRRSLSFREVDFAASWGLSPIRKRADG